MRERLAVAIDTISAQIQRLSDDDRYDLAEILPKLAICTSQEEDENARRRVLEILCNTEGRPYVK